MRVYLAFPILYFVLLFVLLWLLGIPWALAATITLPWIYVLVRAARG